MIRLSIVVAVFNVENYIGDLLDTLVRQDIPKDEYEIVLVDDCSTDQTCKIILEFIEEYPNIRLIRKDKNSGVGLTRNTGVDAARGEYIYIIDSDDYIEVDSLGNVLSAMDRHNLDLVSFEKKDVEEKSKPVLTRKTNGYQFILEEYKPFTGGGIWQRIVRKSLLNEHNISFADRLLGGEDSLWVFEINSHLNFERARTIHAPLYNYRRSPNQATSKMRKTYPQIAENMLRLAKIYSELEKQYISEGMSTEVLDIVHNRITECACQTMFWVSMCDSKENVYTWWERLTEYGLTPIEKLPELIKNNKQKDIKRIIIDNLIYHSHSLNRCKLINQITHMRIVKRIPFVRRFF